MVRAGGASPRLRAIAPVEKSEEERVESEDMVIHSGHVCRRPYLHSSRSTLDSETEVIICQNKNVIIMRSWA